MTKKDFFLDMILSTTPDQGFVAYYNACGYDFAHAVSILRGEEASPEVCGDELVEELVEFFDHYQHNVPPARD